MLRYYNKIYPSPVWSPYTKQDINKVKKVQCLSARFIMGDYLSYSSLSNMIARDSQFAKPRTSQIQCQYYPLL